MSLLPLQPIKTGVIDGADTEIEYQAHPQSHESVPIASYLNFADYTLKLTLDELRSYSLNGSNPPTDATYATYANAGIDDVRSGITGNVDDYNRELVNQSTKLDLAKIADVDAEAKI